jgi:tetratricopeptide (TPR) repeat protein
MISAINHSQNAPQMKAIIVAVILGTIFLGAQNELMPLDAKDNGSFEVRSELTRCREQVRNGEYQEAMKSVNQIIKSFGDKNKLPEAEAVVCSIAIAMGNYEEAWKIISPYSEVNPYQSTQERAYLEVAKVLLQQGKKGEALALCNSIAERASGEIHVLAAVGCGDILMKMGQFRKAIESFTYARSYARLKLYNEDHSYDWLLKRIDSDLARAKNETDNEELGENFIIFRDAQSHRLSGKFDRAILAYDKLLEKFPVGSFSEAAIVYGAVCLASLNKTTEAEERLSKFINQERDGLFRGQALLELGRIATESRVDPKSASEIFGRLNAWIQNTRVQNQSNPRSANDMKDILAAARPLIAPPPSEKQIDAFGNIELSKLTPGMLINERTSDWYLTNLEAYCAKYMGFILFAQGDKKGSIAQFERLRVLDPESKLDEKTHPSDRSRLLWGAENGYLYAMPNELKLYSGRLRFAVLLGDFYYVTQDFVRFRQIFSRILEGDFGALQGDKIAYPQLAYATSIYWSGNRNQAFDEYLKVLTHKNTLSARRATIAVGNLTAVVDKQRAQKGRALIEQLANSEEVDEWVFQARITLATQLMSNPEQRDKLVNVLKSIPNSAGEWYQVAQAYLKEIN